MMITACAYIYIYILRTDLHHSNRSNVQKTSVGISCWSFEMVMLDVNLFGHRYTILTVIGQSVILSVTA